MTHMGGVVSSVWENPEVLLESRVGLKDGGRDSQGTTCRKVL